MLTEQSSSARYAEADIKRLARVWLGVDLGQMTPYSEEWSEWMAWSEYMLEFKT